MTRTQRAAAAVVEWIDYLEGWKWWLYCHCMPTHLHDAVFQRLTNKSIHNSWRLK